MRTTHLMTLTAALTLAQPALAQEPDRYSIPGATVAVYNLAGGVTIERGTGANVVIEVTRGGPDAAQLNVARIEVDGQQALVVRYPDDDVVYDGAGGGSAYVTVRGDGTFGNGSRGDRIRIRRSGSGTRAHANLRILVPAGRGLDLNLGVGEVSANDVEGALSIDVHSAAVRTRNTKGRLNIDTGSGRVAVNDAEGDDIRIDTGSGSVEMNGIRASDLMVDTGSGRVTGAGIVATKVGVDTGSGGITLSDVSASDIMLDTGSGSVTLDLVRQIERLLIDTGSGGVRLAVPANLAASVAIETGSGGVNVDLPISVTSRSRNSLVGTIGSGGGRIQIDTGSGGVTIRAR
jgi:lia operon protein LiaG